MALPVRVADDAQTRKRFYNVHLDSIGQWPATLPGVAPNFGLLLACDADDVPFTEIIKAAEKALASGAGYVVAWGRGCEKIHDAFDETYVLMKLDRPDLPDVMTTWHAGDSLDEALWYFIDVARLPKTEETTDWVAVSVENPEWNHHIRQRLDDLTRFRALIHAGHDELRG